MLSNAFRRNGVAVLNQDCMQVLGSLEDGSIDLIVTDPPYTTTPRGNAGNSGGMLQKQINKDGKVFKHNDITPPSMPMSFIGYSKTVAIAM